MLYILIRGGKNIFIYKQYNYFLYLHSQIMETWYEIPIIIYDIWYFLKSIFSLFTLLPLISKKDIFIYRFYEDLIELYIVITIFFFKSFDKG